MLFLILLQIAPPSGSSNVVDVVFYIKNINYTWVMSNEQNEQTFENDFNDNIVALFDVSLKDIQINSITSGSVIVAFSISTNDRNDLQANITNFIQQQGAPSLSFPSLPAAAFTDPALGATINPALSSAKANYTAAIAGGVVGGLAGLVLVAVALFFVIRKYPIRRPSSSTPSSFAPVTPPKSAKKKNQMQKEQVEMID